MRAIIGAIIFSAVIGSAAAIAQTPAAQPSSSAKLDKEAISKACSDQANAKRLHGKARKKFRSECKRAGGKSM
jgi:hypothetical protein